MPFEAFITRAPDGREQDYEKDFEREPVIQVARALYEHFGQGSKYYALLANLDLPTGKAEHTRQIDALILSEDGLGVIDFKNALAPFTPTLDEQPWKYENGKYVTSGSKNNPNPYHQMLGQREAVYMRLAQLTAHVNEAELPKPLREHCERKLKSKKSNKHFYHFEVAARCVLTGARFEIGEFKREKHQRWFDIMWLDETPDFAKSLSFNKGLTLSEKLIRTLIDDLFALSPWVELEGLYRKPYAYLKRLSDNRTDPLLSTIVTIGRSSDLDVRVMPEMKHVSRRHAIIRQTPDGSVIRDTDSTHGTWINDTQLETGGERPLKHNDLITFGRLKNGKASPYSVQFRYEDATRTELPELEETMGMFSVSEEERFFDDDPHIPGSDSNHG